MSHAVEMLAAEMVKQWIEREGRRSQEAEGCIDLSLSRFGQLLRSCHFENIEKVRAVAKRIAHARDDINLVPAITGNEGFLRIRARAAEDSSLTTATWPAWGASWHLPRPHIIWNPPEPLEAPSPSFRELGTAPAMESQDVEGIQIAPECPDPTKPCFIQPFGGSCAAPRRVGRQL